MDIQKKWQRLQFNRKAQLVFLEDFYSLLQDDVSAHVAIDTIGDVTTGITQIVANSVNNKIAEGKPLAEGMAPWFSVAIVEVIRAGEESGTLLKTIAAAIDSLKQVSGALGAMIAGLLYPLTVFVAAAGLIVFIKSSVLDSFAKIKPVSVWPSVGQTLYNLALIIQHWWWLAVLLLVVSIVVVIKLLQFLTGDVRHVIDRVPVLSLYKDTLSARFMSTLGLLLENGVMLRRALNILQHSAQPYFAWHLDQMEQKLSGGQDNIASLLDTQLIRPSDLARLRIVAKSKGFSQALISLGKKASAHNATIIDRIGKILGGLLLAGSGSIAATMVFGIYTVGSTIAT